jgi:hypothetical protein
VIAGAPIGASSYDGPRVRAIRSVARVVIGVLVGLTLLAMFGNLGDRFILWPTTQPIAAGQAQRRLIALADGMSCEAWVVPARTRARRYALRFYGNADRAEHWAADESRGLPEDVELWGVNYPGYGSSGGKASLRGVAACALGAYDEIARLVPGAPIFALGTSLGTTAALHIAAERKLAGLVLHNPPPLRELIRGRFGWWNLWIVASIVAARIPDGLDSVANARRSRTPAIFVLSQADEIVPHVYHRVVADAYAGDKELILRPGAGHNDPLAPEINRRYQEALLRLFARTQG